MSSSMRHQDVPDELNRIAEKVRACAIEIHRSLGPGLPEAAYEQALAGMLVREGLTVETQVRVPASFRGVPLRTYVWIDMWINGCVVVELKSTANLTRDDVAQVLSYLTFTGARLGLLVNFGGSRLVDGFRRVVQTR